jgi:hypothetical protein
MKRNSELLKVLAKCKPELRKAILKAAEDDLFEAGRLYIGRCNALMSR